ncbi:MAG TPA: ATP synthase F1 subunit delta [Flavitalea sp.]|nr:ATP synthase F1 subunit delta [Flavitalea sp.]
MLNPRLAARYAKSLIDLAIEKGELEAVYKDMLLMQSFMRQSRDLVALLKSPVITADKKEGVLASLTQGRVTEMTKGFNRLLIRKGREAEMPEMVEAFINQYKDIKEIYQVKLTTAQPVSEEVREAILRQVREQTKMQNIELTSVADESLIGGFLLQAGDALVDASISYDLNSIRKQFLNNDFIYKIR